MGMLTEFRVEIAQADEFQPSFYVADRPFDWLLGQLLVKTLVVHDGSNYKFWKITIAGD